MNCSVLYLGLVLVGGGGVGIAGVQADRRVLLVFRSGRCSFGDGDWSG